MAKKPNKRTTRSIWGEHEILPRKIYNWAIGDLNLWCKRTSQEIQFALKRLPASEDGPKLEQPPEDISWSRFALKKEYPSIRITPLFPNRPVVVKPETV